MTSEMKQQPVAIAMERSLFQLTEAAAGGAAALHRRSLGRAVLGLACCLGLAAGATAYATTVCPAPGPLPEAPITLAAHQHFFSYKGYPLPLVGQSYEYLCHISMPQSRQNAYCTLEDYDSFLTTMQSKLNNVIRLWAVFNASPGRSTLGSVYSNDEQPFPYFPATGTWDISQINQNYLNNLEKVVCDAYNKNIIVEVTLLDPWCPMWTTSPFNPVNTVNSQSQGFTQRGYFVSTAGDGNAQNRRTRGYQLAAVERVVSQLKKYPNVIWEVANEPDLIPSAQDLGVSVSLTDVRNWENSIVSSAILPFDSTHLIEVNGHTTSTFAWDLQQSSTLLVDTAHYTQSPTAGIDGAIALMRDGSQTNLRSNFALGFNENHVIPDPTTPPANGRTAADVRSEAWEFAFDAGALFDGYSTNYSDQAGSAAASTQLGVLGAFLGLGNHSSNSAFVSTLGTMQQTSCNLSGNWCQGLPAWNNEDRGSCSAQEARIYWSTMQSGSEMALYIHHGIERSSVAVKKGQDGYSAVVCGTGTTNNGYQIPGSFQYVVYETASNVVCVQEWWIDPASGSSLAHNYRTMNANTWYGPAVAPWFSQDILLFTTWFSAPTSGICKWGL